MTGKPTRPLALRELVETFEVEKALEFDRQMATDIEKVSEGVRIMFGGRLTDEGLLLLLCNSTKMSESAIRKVLLALRNLKKRYLK